MRLKLFTILILFGLLPTREMVFAQPGSLKDIQTITGRLIKNYLAGPVDDKKISELFAALRSDGGWRHIDYDTITNDFLAEEHLKNLKAMAIAYAKAGSKFYHNENLKQKILLGYQYFLNKKPKSLNWWYNEIGAQQIYMVGLLLLKNEMAPEDVRHYSSYLKDLTDNAGHQGMNRIWVSAITLHKGCIENDSELIEKGFKGVASTLVIADGQRVEGIKIDNSFHQHRPQLYSGGYGMSFAESTATLMALSANTYFSSIFSADKKKLFSDLLFKGHQLFSYRNAVDFGTIGRNIARPGAIKGISPLTLDELAIIDAPQASSYLNWKAHLQGADFPEFYRGNKYFWKSDIMTQHGKDYYLSAKVISRRTNGTEMLNGENLKGYNLPLGATNIMTTGEEYRDIFPVWDWTRVPGTTAVMNQAAAVLPWYLFGTNEFAGGISNGQIGAIAYEHSYNGIQAKKAYFFADGEMLCLGAGINAIRTQQVVTSVNQCYSKNEIRMGQENENVKLEPKDSLKFLNGELLKWVFHDGVGYIFPSGGDIVLKNAMQSGSWKAIGAGDSEIISKPVFSLWLNHGTAPSDDSYAYIVSPNISFEDFKRKAMSQSFTILVNDKHIQTVKYRESYFIIFYGAGTAKLENGLDISSGSEAIVMMEPKNKGFQLSVSDPTHQQDIIKISINQKLKGQAVSYSKDGLSTIVFDCPEGDYKGSSITRFYEK